MRAALYRSARRKSITRSTGSTGALRPTRSGHARRGAAFVIAPPRGLLGCVALAVIVLQTAVIAGVVFSIRPTSSGDGGGDAGVD
jgi:hypothetical protein